LVFKVEAPRDGDRDWRSYGFAPAASLAAFELMPGALEGAIDGGFIT
jgi:hypothetical protein